MVTAIFKYKVWAPTQTVFPGYVMKANGEQSVVKMPPGAIVRHVGEQDGELYIWAEVNPMVNAEENRFFEVYGTGDHIHTDMGVDREFLATVLCTNGLVWHVFEYKGV